VSDATTFPVGTITLTRVPYFDVGLDAEGLNLSAGVIAAAGSVATPWLDESGQPLVGVAVWVVESDGRVVVVDPCGAADAFIRTGPEAITHQDAVFAALEAAGYPRERVDTLVLSHLDGIGMAAAVTDDGRWVPAFPRARVVMTAPELTFLAAPTYAVQGNEALQALVDQGVVDGVADGYEVAPGVTLQLTGAHSPGHAIVRVESGGALALLIGHLAITPIHLVSGRCEGMHEDADAAVAVLDAVLDEAIERSALLVGPLWAAPGACVVGPDRAPKPA
jgi:glyoxylase-like metal-dependent hydrolase (beta-lactamase superfamily II)